MGGFSLVHVFHCCLADLLLVVDSLIKPYSVLLTQNYAVCDILLSHVSAWQVVFRYSSSICGVNLVRWYLFTSF